jgi:hypothetical protein
MIQFGLLLGANPSDRLAFIMNLVSESPSVVIAHAGDISHQAGVDMFESIKVIIQDNNFKVGIKLLGSFFDPIGSGNWSHRLTSYVGVMEFIWGFN